MSQQVLQMIMPDPGLLRRVFGTLEEGMQHCEERFLHLARYHGIIKPTTTSLSLPVGFLLHVCCAAGSCLARQIRAGACKILMVLSYEGCTIFF